MPHTIHKRFGIALLRKALTGAGTLHVDYRVDNEPEWVHAWVPRRTANDEAPPPKESPDPKERLGQGILSAVMGAAGMVQQSMLIGTEPDWLDLYFEPDEAGIAAPGMLGQ